MTTQSVPAPYSPVPIITPWQHGERDIQRTGERYNAHNTGDLLTRLRDEYYWELATQYTRKSQRLDRRPFALHAATLRHPDAPTFAALGQSWTLALYVRNAHDGTAALNSSLLLTRGSFKGAAVLAQAPASCRVRHSRTNERAQAIASSAADAIPAATSLLLTWSREPARRSADEVLAAALRMRFGESVDENGTPPIYRGRWGVEPMTRLDEYIAAACIALEGGYYLQSSERVCRDIRNVSTREQIMAKAWDWMTT